MEGTQPNFESCFLLARRFRRNPAQILKMAGYPESLVQAVGLFKGGEAPPVLSESDLYPKLEEAAIHRKVQDLVQAGHLEPIREAVDRLWAVHVEFWNALDEFLEGAGLQRGVLIYGGEVLRQVGAGPEDVSKMKAMGEVKGWRHVSQLAGEGFQTVHVYLRGGKIPQEAARTLNTLLDTCCRGIRSFGLR